MDVISLHQAGFGTAVCACGTALTEEQVKLLTNYADEVVLAYDSDEAGQKATARSLGLFKNTPIKVTVLNIPGAKDPDEFIKKNGADAFGRLLDKSANGIEYNLEKLRSRYDLSTDNGKVEYLRDALTLLASGLTPTEREIYAGRIAEQTNVSKATVLNQLESTVRRVSDRQRRQRQRDLQKEMVPAQIKVPYSLGGDKALAAVNAEQQLLAAMLKDPSRIPALRDRVDPGDLIMPEDQELCRALYGLPPQTGTTVLTALGSQLGEEGMSLAAQLLARNSDNALTARDVELFVQRIKQRTTAKAQAPQSEEEMRRRLEALTKAKTQSNTQS